MKHCLLFALLALGLPGLGWAEMRYVQVDSARLLSRPSAFSRLKAKLAYRTEVELLDRHGAYYQVKCAAGVGYLAQRSVSQERPRFTAKLSGNYVSSDEVAMATKGFNAQVESDYRQKNPNLDYAGLNRLEQQTQYPEPAVTFAEFRKTGKLGEFKPGGDAE